jgi:hypothetical protein
MVTQELIDNIARRFRQGQTKEEIKQSLVEEGWEDIDVDEAISHIQKTALSQLPFIAAYTKFMTELDAKTANLSMPMVLAVCGFFAIIVLLVAVALYNLLDPFNVRPAERDTQRQQALTKLQTAVQKYYKDKHMYPSSLEQLAPTYIQPVPKDPKTGKDYSYKTLDKQMNYDLCITFEVQAEQCVSSATSSSIPVVRPNDMGTDTNSSVASTITGLVFLDGNANGKKDGKDAETAFVDAPITISDMSSKPVCQVRTDTTGTFLCNLATDGTYQVMLEAPVGFRVTTPNPQIVTFPDPTDPSRKSAGVSFGVAPTNSSAQQSAQ